MTTPLRTAAAASALVLGATLLAAPPATAAPRTVRLDGVTVALRPGTAQVVTVNRTRGYHARVTFWRKRDGRWTVKRRTTNGRIGYGGLVAAASRRQSTGTTPLGTFAVTEAFGIRARPAGTRVPYRKVRAGDYWVQDNRSAFYNTLRNKSAGGFRWWLPTTSVNASERLQDYRRQYAWSIVVDFNRPRPVRHRGSGIFLHANGKGATAGCVSVPASFVRYVLRRLSPRLEPLVAIGR